MSVLTDRLRGIVGGAVPRVAPELRPGAAGTEVPALRTNIAGTEDPALRTDVAGAEVPALRTDVAGTDATASPKARPSRGLSVDDLGRAADVLGGAVVTSSTGATIVVERSYGAAQLYGRVRIADVTRTLAEGHEALALLNGGTARGDASGGLWFLDLETTGLAGGAGTQAFLVGVAHLGEDGVHVRQFLMPGYEHERALLLEVAAWAAARGMLVTFNGKSFDVPLIETRYLLHRVPFPFEDVPHTDMLHPARRLWRARGAVHGALEASCSLITLERLLAGVSRVGDVPGFEIPGRYFQFVRDGEASPLEAVLEHNRLDLVSLALVMAHALQLIARGPTATRDPYECLGLARIYDRAGRADEADAAYMAAIEQLTRIGRDPDTCGDALRRLAHCRRRAGRLREAAAAWQRLADLPRCPAAYRLEAREALAIFHEHRARDFSAAHGHAAQLLREAGQGRKRDEAEHRLRRLERKLGVGRSAPLWEEPAER